VAALKYGEAPLEVIFGGTLLLGAFLLFVVEPMFAKMVLPLLGGSPAVWNTCVLFFQSMLLLGYLYAHLAPRLLGVRRHAVFHLVAVLLSLLALPITLHRMGSPPTSGSPVGWLLQVLMLSLGIPFLLLSSTGPLVQQWFSATRRSGNPDPYFLYSASNAGSLLGLLAYPLVIEASLPLSGQARVWTGGYALLTALIAGCVCVLWYLPSRPETLFGGDSSGDSEKSAEIRRARWRERLVWVVLAFLPSSLLLGLTTYVTMDIAAIPLLWVVPFAVYLLTYVIAFARTPVIRREWVIRLQPLFVIALVVLMFWGRYLASPAFLPFHLATFFLTAMVCHGELAARRPRAVRLTEYYLWLSLGGALGGVFNVLLAPNVFKSVLEYPLVLVLACLVTPSTVKASTSVVWTVLGALFAFIVLLAARHALTTYHGPGASAPMLLWAGVIVASYAAAVVCYRARNEPRALTATLGVIVAASVLAEGARGDLILNERNFYGIHQVRYNPADSTHLLLNGTTKHGAQALTPRRRREPLSYYTRTGPLGDVFREIPATPGRAVAVVGLGAGATLAYGVAGERWTVYEIDPTVVQIARDPRCFTYLADSPARVDLVLGDGRLSLARAKDRSFSLIVLDAFSSDAIPVHLLTREALNVYFRKLTPGGALALHLSNRYLNLEPVVARLAADAGAASRIRVNTAHIQEHFGEDVSVWAVLTLDPRSLGGLAKDSRWRPLKGLPQIKIWTDDYSDVLMALRAVPSF
jgi:spermidine synthase